ncbi:hypothetical protein [Ruminococcus albus]|uniref:Uncharacterized protein n=1 Tax=Ruminococcus albus TaxID=1264 RepID=A0A1I1HNH2_RUMAL|nr:hypothetical protein [Ruminococcus albus]SFC25335.1 hypothetical protein SAMN02910406_01418 [Ruminococcus albus]
MHQNELHPRRNFMFFCFSVHIVGAMIPILFGKLDTELPGDLPLIIYILGVPLMLMPVSYLILYDSFTCGNDRAVGKHFKEIGIWLAFVFPVSYIIYNILDSVYVYELTDHTSVEEPYVIYIIVCSLSFIFVTPLFKLGRMIAISVKKASMKDMYDYYTENRNTYNGG